MGKYEVGQLVIINKDCRRWKRAINKIGYISKLRPLQLLDMELEIVTIKYSRFGRIQGFQCFWIPEKTLKNILSENTESVVLRNLSEQFKEALEISSKFVKRIFTNKIAEIEEIIKSRSIYNEGKVF